MFEGVSAKKVVIDNAPDVEHFVDHIILSALLLVNLLVNECVILFVEQKEGIPEFPQNDPF